jgi:hypothetical protein
MTDQLAKPPPTVGLRAIDRRAHAGGTEAQQCFGRFPIMPGNESDGGDRGEFPHKAGDGRQRFSLTAMHRNNDDIYAAATGDVQCLSQRLGVQCVEAAVARRVKARALGSREDCADGDHARVC